MVRRNPSCAMCPTTLNDAQEALRTGERLHWQGRGISSFIGKEGEALIPGGRYYCVTCDVGGHEIRQ